MGSAGYDFFIQDDVTIPSMWREILTFRRIKPTLVKTGVKAYMQTNEVLKLYPRSSTAKRLGLVVPNSVGIIDSDYYNNPDNEGEIAFIFYNIWPKAVQLHRGDKVGQGIFTAYLKVDDDSTNVTRSGGIGSTNQNK